jgi:transcription-repair coupling factor (superfamily II helicase)
VPEARIGIAHGQMPERELEQVMLDFQKQRFNVLLCTTIIESGIDIPNANTIIINRADKFGLAQLHQLRGRVGRSHHRAYAYLVVPDKRRSPPTRRSGWRRSPRWTNSAPASPWPPTTWKSAAPANCWARTRAGRWPKSASACTPNCWNARCAVIKQGKLPDVDGATRRGADVELHVPALIPDDYLPDVHTRLTLYKRISSAPRQRCLRELQVEMIDRFGLLPDPTKHLFATAELKLDADALGIRKLDLGETGGRIVSRPSPRSIRCR